MGPSSVAYPESHDKSIIYKILIVCSLMSTTSIVTVWPWLFIAISCKMLSSSSISGGTEPNCYICYVNVLFV